MRLSNAGIVVVLFLSVWRCVLLCFANVVALVASSVGRKECKLMNPNGGLATTSEDECEKPDEGSSRQAGISMQAG